MVKEIMKWMQGSWDSLCYYTTTVVVNGFVSYCPLLQLFYVLMNIISNG